MLEKFINSVAWGGCSVHPTPKYSIVCHTHRDHIPKDLSITVVGPVAFLNRDPKSKHPIDFNRSTKLRVEGITAVITVMGRRYLNAYGVKEKLHCHPIIVKVGGENALYIDDINVQDKKAVITLIKNLKAAMGDSFTTVLIPVYGGMRAHGANDPKELCEASKEIMLHALSMNLKVVALGHPHIPSWVPDSPSIRKIPRTLPVMSD